MINSMWHLIFFLSSVKKEEHFQLDDENSSKYVLHFNGLSVTACYLNTPTLEEVPVGMELYSIDHVALIPMLIKKYIDITASFSFFFQSIISENLG